MPLIVKIIDNPEQWSDIENRLKPQTFLQSWQWGEFQEKMGHKIWRLGIFSGDNFAAAALVAKIVAKRGTFFLIQHGPCLAKSVANLPDEQKKIFVLLLAELKKIGILEKADFIRISPLWERTPANKNFFKDLGFREAPMHANAYEATWLLDITADEESLLLGMRKTTRYLIRQALKNKDISISKSISAESLRDFQKLNRATAKKHSFTAFSSEYIKNEFEIFSKNNQALLFMGNYRGELAAAALVIFWSTKAFYHQAASGYKHQKLSLPYLIAWEAIKEAKKRGCLLFDFWGYTNPRTAPNHPWAGPTLFKMGFGGKAYEYLKTQDYPLSKKYWLNYLIEKARKFKRGY